jgi:replicative DNA helicase
LHDSLFVAHQTVFKAFRDIISTGGNVNLISLTQSLGEAYFEPLTNIIKSIDYDVDTETWLNLLINEDKTRKCTVILSRLNDCIIKNETDNFEQILQQSMGEFSENITEHKDIKEHVRDIIKHVENIQTGQAVTGFPTGINVYDKFTGGFHQTDLVIIAAETSQGKTTFALNIAYNNAINGTYAALFSLEMSIQQLTARLSAIDTNMSSKDILRGTVNLPEMTSKLKGILNNRILLDNTRNSSLESIISKMRYFVSRFNCRLFFIDYLQLISYHKKGNSTEQNLAEICRALKNFAKENDSAVILLCQLNRDNTGSTAPKLSRLRGSGQIEEAADSVIFVQRPTPSQFGEPEVAKIIQQKGRNSGTGEFDLSFEGFVPTFRNL